MVPRGECNAYPRSWTRRQQPGLAGVTWIKAGERGSGQASDAHGQAWSVAPKTPAVAGRARRGHFFFGGFLALISIANRPTPCAATT